MKADESESTFCVTFHQFPAAAKTWNSEWSESMRNGRHIFTTSHNKAILKKFIEGLRNFN